MTCVHHFSAHSHILIEIFSNTFSILLIFPKIIYFLIHCKNDTQSYDGWPCAPLQFTHCTLEWRLSCVVEWENMPTSACQYLQCQNVSFIVWCHFHFKCICLISSARLQATWRPGILLLFYCSHSLTQYLSTRSTTRVFSPAKLFSPSHVLLSCLLELLFL